jgi:DNA invertase Pin-like site-specific DNA recombinase
MGNALDAIKDTGKVIGYVRVSTLDQNHARQLDGIKVDKVFMDTVSGKDTNRPQLQACIDYIRDGDTLLVHSMDRLARNVEDLRRLVRDILAKGVVIKFVKENLTFSPKGENIFDQLMLTLLGAFAEFERALIRERQREGIALAKERGVYKGRPHLKPDQVAALYAKIDAGVPKARVARLFGIGRTTVYDYLAARERGEGNAVSGKEEGVVQGVPEKHRSG